jgi:hypothetical protein
VEKTGNLGLPARAYFPLCPAFPHPIPWGFRVALGCRLLAFPALPEGPLRRSGRQPIALLRLNVTVGGDFLLIGGGIEDEINVLPAMLLWVIIHVCTTGLLVA